MSRARTTTSTAAKSNSKIRSIVKVREVGMTLVVTLPRDLLARFKVSAGDCVMLSATADAVTITKER